MALLDVLKVKEFKAQIENLTAANDKLNSDLTQIRDLKLSLEKMTVLELQEEIQRKTQEIADLNTTLSIIGSEIQENEKSIQSRLDQIRNLDKSIQGQLDQIKDLEKQLKSTSDDIEVESYGLYRPTYDFATALGYKDKLAEVRQKQKQMIKEKSAVNFFADWTVNGSKTQGRKMTNDNIKIMLRAFNNECEAAINKVKYNNLPTIKDRIFKSYEDMNKMNVVNRCDIRKEYLNLKISELTLAYEYERKKEEEKEALREQREKEREEKALQKEIESKKKIIDKEMKHISNIIDELELKLMVAPDLEKEAISKQIQELKENLLKFEEEKEELDWRLVHAAAGYVYIISNIGSFGKNVFKIGVTRRLDPLERISELSSASVPFKFDVHALIFSYDAYQLENELHKRFDQSRINLVNNRKEFFRLSLDEIKTELDKHKDLTIDFKEIPDAEEYRESSKLPIQ